MVVEIDKSIAENASPTDHREKAKEQVENRSEESGSQILLKKVKKLYKQAVFAKEPVQKMQLESFKWYMTGDFENDVIDGGEHHVNFVKTLIRNIRSRILDADPAPVSIPRKRDDWHVANMHDATLKYILDANDWKSVLNNVIFDAVVKGDGFTKEYWDPDKGEKGNARIEYIDALRIFPGSSSRQLQDQGNIHILHSDPLHKVVERWPDAEMEAAASAGGPFPHFGDKEFFSDRLPLSAFSQHSREMFEDQAVDAFVGGEGENRGDLRSFDDNVNYVESFIRYPNGHPLAEDFPNGRRVFYTEKAVLADQKWNKERLPYTQYPIETEGDLFWHKSLVQQLSSPQRVINKLSNLVVESAEKQAKSPLITPKQGGLDETEYRETSDVAEKVLYMSPVGAQQTGYLQSPPFPAEALETMKMYIKQTEQLSGVQDISQGRIPGSLQSGEAIDLLQEAAQTIIRHYNRPIQSGVKRLGLSLSEIIQDHFTEERVIRTSDKPHNEFVTINKSVEMEQARKNLREAALQQGEQGQNAQQKAQRAVQLIRQEQQDKKEINDRIAEVVINDPSLVPVDIRVAAGGDRLSRAGRVKEALRFFEADAIDERELLKVANWDNLDEVLDRVEERKILTQQVEGLQERLENLQNAIKEVMSQVDGEAQQLLRSAVTQQS